MPGSRHALLIANETYDDPTLADLVSPGHDVDELDRVLSDPHIGDFSTEVVRNTTDADLRRKIASFLCKRRTKDDLLLIHMSCHGVKDDRGFLYFASTDTECDSLDATAISAEFVKQQMDLSASQKIVLLLDCCYSGAFGDTGDFKSTGTVDLERRFEGRGRVVLTASTSMQFAQQGATPGAAEPSLFTKALVVGLETGDAAPGDNDWISVDQLYEFARDYMVEQESTQRPTRWSYTDDDIIVAHRQPGSSARRAPGNQLDYSELRDPLLLDEHDGEVYAVAIAAGSNVVAAAVEGGVRIWHHRTTVSSWADGGPPEPVTVTDGFEGFVYALAFSPDGRLLASAGEDGSVHVHRIEADGTLRRVWVGRRHTEAVYSVDFSADGLVLASGSYDRSVVLWRTANGTVRNRRNQSGRVSSVAISPEAGSLRVAIGSLDNSISVWDVKASTVYQLGEHASSVEDLAFSTDGAMLASCGLDKAVACWNMRAATPHQAWLNHAEHEYLVRSVAFAPGGGTIVSASWDKTIRFWETSTGIPYEPPSGVDWPCHTDWIWSARFSPDGEALVTCGSDGRILLLRLPGPPTVHG